MASSKWKWIIGGIGTIVLGALGSGLWSLVFAPLFNQVAHGFLSLVTLGLSSASDSLYAAAAKGYRERAGLILLYFLGVAFAIAPITALAIELIIPRLKRKLEKFSGEELSRTEVKLRKTMRRLLLAAVFMGSVLFVQIVMESYINRIITYFSQSLAICRPFLGQHDYDVFLSRFARMKTRSDFLTMIHDLDTIAKANNTNLPDSPP